MGLLPDNLDDGMEMAAEIEKLHALKRELKAGIAQTELGEYDKHFVEHPLYAQINTRIMELRVAITELV